MIKHDTHTATPRGQSGSAILSAVIFMGIVMLLIQGNTWYRANEGIKFMSKEKKKVVAMQLAEAGVEENIADLAKRTVIPVATTTNLVTYDHKPLVGGNYTSRLSSVAMGAGAFPDTVDITSTGAVGSIQQTIQARLRLNKYTGTTTTTPANPSTMPPVTSTPEYAACVSPCRVCHIPPGPNLPARYVITQAKALMVTHNGCVGDYITTNGTCDRYDAMVAIRDSVKVQIISWK